MGPITDHRQLPYMWAMSGFMNVHGGWLDSFGVSRNSCCAASAREHEWLEVVEHHIIGAWWLKEQWKRWRWTTRWVFLVKLTHWVFWRLLMAGVRKFRQASNFRAEWTLLSRLSRVEFVSKESSWHWRETVQKGTSCSIWRAIILRGVLQLQWTWKLSQGPGIAKTVLLWSGKGQG